MQNDKTGSYSSYRDFDTYLKNFPDENGYFGKYGGAYLPEQLVPAFKEISEAYQTICHSAKSSPSFAVSERIPGQTDAVYHCERLSNKLGLCQIYLKREDLNHTGAHKLNHLHGRRSARKIHG